MLFTPAGLKPFGRRSASKFLPVGRCGGILHCPHPSILAPHPSLLAQAITGEDGQGGKHTGRQCGLSLESMKGLIWILFAQAK